MLKRLTSFIAQTTICKWFPGAGVLIWLNKLYSLHCLCVTSYVSVVGLIKWVPSVCINYWLRVPNGLENHGKPGKWENIFQTWKNHGIWKKCQNHGISKYPYGKKFLPSAHSNQCWAYADDLADAVDQLLIISGAPFLKMAHPNPKSAQVLVCLLEPCSCNHASLDMWGVIMLGDFLGVVFYKVIYDIYMIELPQSGSCLQLALMR